MNDPAYTGELGARPYDRAHDERREPPSPQVQCRDCGHDITTGAQSVSDVLEDDSVFSATYCRACGDFRSQRGWLFDPRPVAQLIATRRSA